MTQDPVPRKIILQRPLHSYYKYKDVDKAVQFLNDFGFTEAKRVSDDKIYFRGYGADPWIICAQKGDVNEFGGVGFEVASEEELQYAAKTLPNATDVYELGDAPGGGKGVTFYDPVDGAPFHLVFGQQNAGMLEIPLPHEAVNYPTEKQRPVNKKQRFQKRPAPVHKLGHFGHCTVDFAKTYDFYRTRFNFIPSDLIYDEEGVDKTCFMRLDRGKEQVDHHCFFFKEGPRYHIHHSSYETHDFDTQVLGHDWLREKGYENCWGVGRHVLGSQIFDYWFDPSGFIMEHYVDGDQVDNTEPTHRSKATKDSLHIWGPEPAPHFLKYGYTEQYTHK